jgi:hypothetical protein
VAKRVKRPIQRKVELAECGGMHLGGSPEVSGKLLHGRKARVLGDPVVDFDERRLRDLRLLGEGLHV